MPTPQWSPASVLQLDPSSTCIGHAKTQGRRCRNPIAYANRQESEKVLLEMSRLDFQSPRLDCYLEELASRLLCRRWHQDQAVEIKREWQRRIERFLAAETARRVERERERRERRERRMRRESVVASFSGARSPGVEVGGETVTASMVIHAFFSLTVSINLGEDSGGRGNNEPREEPRQQADQNAHSSSPRTESPQDATNQQQNNSSHPSSPNEPTTRTPGALTQEHPTTNRAEEREEAANSAEPPQPVRDQSTPAQPQPAQHDTSLHTHRERRPIEGECSVCYENLSDGDDTAWCRAQCRNNFHADCLGLWHASQEADETVKTCPYCRTEWAA